MNCFQPVRARRIRVIEDKETETGSYCELVNNDGNSSSELENIKRSITRRKHYVDSNWSQWFSHWLAGFECDRCSHVPSVLPKLPSLSCLNRLNQTGSTPNAVSRFTSTISVAKLRCSIIAKRPCNYRNVTALSFRTAFNCHLRVEVLFWSTFLMIANKKTTAMILANLYSSTLKPRW